VLYYVMRPSSATESFPTFTRLGGLSKSLAGCQHRAQGCLGRVYSTDGHSVQLVSDYYVEPVPAAPLSRREYRAARAQAAIFA
jgi:hypothetical protein